MKTPLLSMCLLLSLMTQTADAVTVTIPLFSDDFDTEPLGFNATLNNWTVLQGSVDVVTCAGSGRCVDIDGSMSGSPPTIMETKALFDFVEGRTYSLTFNIPTGTQADPVTFSFGPVLQRSYSSYTFPLADEISGVAGANGSAPLRIALGSDSNNNFGPYLTFISLTESYVDGGPPPPPPPLPIPLPASAPLLIGGIFLLGVMRRLRGGF